MHHQIWTHFFNVLGYETKLRSAIRINFFFVAKCNRTQSKDRLACHFHRFNVVLESRRGWLNAKLTSEVVHENRRASNCDSTDTVNEDARLQGRAQLDSAGLASGTERTNKDIIIFGGEIFTRPLTQNNVAAPSSVE